MSTSSLFNFTHCAPFHLRRRRLEHAQYQVKASSSSSSNSIPQSSAKWKTVAKSKNLKEEESEGLVPEIGSSVNISETETSQAESEVASDILVVTEGSKQQHLFAYPDWPASSYYVQAEDEAAAAKALCDAVDEASRKAVTERGTFSLVLSGGSLVKALRYLPGRDLAWDRWHIFWADERVVPLTHPDSNFKAAQETFLSKVPIPSSQLYTIDDTLAVGSSAAAYESQLKKLADEGILEVTAGVPYPRFDLILLGLGPDGHVASLFPNSPTLASKLKWVLPVLNSPKPPPERITLSLQSINCAKTILFLATGRGKSFVVERALQRPALPGSLPAQMVRPYQGTVGWIVDADAASDLNLSSWEDPKSFPYLNFN